MRPTAREARVKRIIILCDGTWNAADMPHPTNVVRLARGLMPVDVNDVAQVPIYVPGVGTGRRGVTRLSRLTDRLLGGLMGLGLMQNVTEAYLHLVFLYEPGDEIYVFGFSRGAFTARSLTGLIRSSGILSRSTLHLLPEVVDRYRSHDPATHPKTEESAAFRARVSPWLLTSEADRDAYADAGHPDAMLLQLAFLGVWDSVGSLGIPSRFGVAKLWNDKFRFHDAALSSIVVSARHAVALDERRREFEPTLWTNLDALNAGANPDDPPYQERFFAGDHGSVGGGGEIVDLSSIALTWVIEGAAARGLAFDAGLVAEIAAQGYPMGPLTNAKVPKGGWPAKLLKKLGRDREGPAAIAGLHGSVLDRWAFESKEGEKPPHGSWPYRPRGLSRIERDLKAWQDARLAEPPGETRIT